MVHTRHTNPQITFNGSIVQTKRKESTHTAKENVIRFSSLNGMRKKFSMLASVSSVADPSWCRESMLRRSLMMYSFMVCLVFISTGGCCACFVSDDLTVLLLLTVRALLVVVTESSFSERMPRDRSREARLVELLSCGVTELLLLLPWIADATSGDLLLFVLLLKFEK